MNTLDTRPQSHMHSLIHYLFQIIASPGQLAFFWAQSVPLSTFSSYLSSSGLLYKVAANWINRNQDLESGSHVFNDVGFSNIGSSFGNRGMLLL